MSQEILHCQLDIGRYQEKLLIKKKLPNLNM